jgi:hypothetical protein
MGIMWVAGRYNGGVELGLTGTVCRSASLLMDKQVAGNPGQWRVETWVLGVPFRDGKAS